MFLLWLVLHCSLARRTLMTLGVLWRRIRRRSYTFRLARSKTPFSWGDNIECSLSIILFLACSFVVSERRFILYFFVCFFVPWNVPGFLFDRAVKNLDNFRWSLTASWSSSICVSISGNLDRRAIINALSRSYCVSATSFRDFVFFFFFFPQESRILFRQSDILKMIKYCTVFLYLLHNDVYLMIRKDMIRKDMELICVNLRDKRNGEIYQYIDIALQMVWDRIEWWLMMMSDDDDDDDNSSSFYYTLYK